MSSQSVVLLIMGVSGSGKSVIGKQLAESLDYAFIDADKYHTLSNKAKMRNGIPLTDEDRIPWLEELSEFINDWVTKGINGVLACSALKDDYRKILVAKATHCHILYLKGSYELIANRLANRQHEFMNSNLLLSQWNTLEEPENAIVLDASLSPEEIIRSALKKLKETELREERFFQ